MDTNTDSLIRFLLPDLRVRGCMLHAPTLCAQAREIHGLGDEVGDLFSHLLVGAILMLSLSKGGIRQVLQIDAIDRQAPIRRMLSEVQKQGVRGYIDWGENTSRRATGEGLRSWMGSPVRVSLVRDFGHGTPYVSTIESSGTYMAYHLTHFVLQSIQTRADFVLQHERGIMLEAMPGCTQEHWQEALQALLQLRLEESKPSASLHAFDAKGGARIVGRDAWRWHCHCNPEHMLQALHRMPAEKRNAWANANGDIILRCQYCRRQHRLNIAHSQPTA